MVSSLQEIKSFILPFDFLFFYPGTSIVSQSSLHSSSFCDNQKRAALTIVCDEKRRKIDLEEGKANQSRSVAVSSAFSGFPGDAHFRANAIYRAKHGVDRPNGRNHVMLCNCSDKYILIVTRYNQILTNVFFFKDSDQQQRMLFLTRGNRFSIMGKSIFGVAAKRASCSKKRTTHQYI